MLSERGSEADREAAEAVCPFATGPAAGPARVLRPSDRLSLPLAKAAWIEPGVAPDGHAQLTFWHRGHEIVFDDPRRFAFARGLVGQASFAAQDAVEWSGLGWGEVAGLLGDLVTAGVLVRGDATVVRHDHARMADPLGPAPMAAPRGWTDPASLMAELTGTALDPYWLECVVPVFRVAHCFLDADGRQVGESNTFPPAARLAVPTDWRGCPYPGNRYQPDKPMNATALRAMRAHWRDVLALLAGMREAYLARCPEARSGWTVGHVERMACAVLALPSVLLLRSEGGVANGTLHPALSSLFRVTDGLRLVMHQMLFIPVHEAMRRPDEPVDAAAILAYADRNFSFHSDHAVCAGPRFMVEDMLAVLLDGKAPAGGMTGRLAPELAAVLAEADAALDYAFLGLETFGTVFSLWPAMARTYARLHTLLADAGIGGALAERFAGHFAALQNRSFLADEAWRQHREAVYDDMVAECVRARTGAAPAFPLSADLAIPAPTTPQAGIGRRPAVQLARPVAAVFGPDHGALAERFAAEIEHFLQVAQRVVARAERVQAEVARLLGRPAPAHRLTLDHLDLHNALLGDDVRSLPFLPRQIGKLFGLAIHVDAGSIQISRAAKAASSPHSEGAKPIGSRSFAHA